MIVERQLEDGYEILEVNRPCVLTAVKELNEPRYMTVIGIENAYRKEIPVWNEIRYRHRSAGLRTECQSDEGLQKLYAASEGKRARCSRGR